MPHLRALSRKEQGSVFVLTMVIGGIVATSAIFLVVLGQNTYRSQSKRVARKDAFYLAEAGVQHALFRIAEDNTTFNTSLLLGAAVNWSATPGQANSNLPNVTLDGRRQELKVRIENAPSAIKGQYQVTAQATAFDVTQGVRVVAQKNPPSNVFDYEYFLNNWGWWWGRSIGGNGDNRSNGDFDFREGPEVNGHTYAAGDIRSDSDLRGWAAPESGSDLPWDEAYIHMFNDRVRMPNLLDLNYYKDRANNWKTDEHGAIINGSLTGGVNGINIQGVYTGNIYLAGTASNPLVLNGPVVIDGNAILGGYVTGKGTLYVGRNLYLVDSVQYKNAPNSPRPSDNTETARNNWALANQDKDLVAYAARESIFFGDITDSSRWNYPWCYFLRGWGDESQLGRDGIPDTADDGVSYDRDGDGVLDGAWFDTDEDGVVDGNYQWRDIAPNPACSTEYQTGDISSFAYWPLDAYGNRLAWNQLGPSQGPGAIQKLEGVFYTNHAFSGRTTFNNSAINGSVISKDEAIIYTTKITFNYDERIHGRYIQNPNLIIDLGLPVADKVRILSWEETGAVL